MCDALAIPRLSNDGTLHWAFTSLRQYCFYNERPDATVCYKCIKSDCRIIRRENGMLLCIYSESLVTLATYVNNFR